MRVIRHGKPAKAFTSRLKRVTRADYERLVHGCIEAIIGGAKDVIVLFPYTVKFPKDFPRGILEDKREDGSNVHRIKAAKLLNWLKSRGYTDITTDKLRAQQIAFGLETTKLEKMFDFTVELEDNNEIEKGIEWHNQGAGV